VIFIVWACWAFATWPLTLFERFLFIFSVGANGGVLGINIAHELIHKQTALEKLCGKILLVTVSYGHFYIEHILGHHRNVSTPHDPASSKLNETFYGFYPRTVVGSFMSAIHLENARLEKRGKSRWSLDNQMIHFVGGSIGCAVFAGVMFGYLGAVMFIGQSFIAFSFLEVVNYIEHYGLARREWSGNAQSSYEPVSVLHSWNADARITNAVLFKLQRHSDHHAHAMRRYQILRTFDESPQMPTGYAGMITLALLPPIWFKLMNPRVEKFQERLKASVDLSSLKPITTAWNAEN